MPTSWGEATPANPEDYGDLLMAVFDGIEYQPSGTNSVMDDLYTVAKQESLTHQFRTKKVTEEATGTEWSITDTQAVDRDLETQELYSNRQISLDKRTPKGTTTITLDVLAQSTWTAHTGEEPAEPIDAVAELLHGLKVLAEGE